MLSVRPMNETTVSLYNRIDNRYLAEERVRFYTEGHEFSLEYTPLNEPQGRTYPPDAVYTAQDILQRKDAVCFFAYWGEQPAGQAVVTAHWNHLAFLWDIRVDVPHRNKGVGRALLSACAGWARDQKLKGLFVETQDDNPSACKFYQRNGFMLGGVDRLLYAAIPRKGENPPSKRESALFFYLLFD